MSGQLRYKALHMDSTEISGVLKQLYGLRAFAHGYRFAALFGFVWLTVSGDKKACLMRGSGALPAYFVFINVASPATLAPLGLYGIDNY